MGLANDILDFFVPNQKALFNGTSARDLTNRSLERGKKVKKGDLGSAMQAAAGDTMDLFKTAIPAAAEAGSFMLPVGAGAKALVSGAGRGVLSAVAHTKADNPLQFIKDTATNAGISSLGEAAIPFGGNIVSKFLPKGTPVVNNAVSNTVGKAFGETPEQIAKYSADAGKAMPSTPTKMWLSAFNFPAKVGKRLQPIETAKQMLNYGITGGVDQIAEQVGKITDMTTRYTNAIARNIKAPIPINDVTNLVENTLKKSIAVTPEEKQGIIEHITNARDGASAMSGEEALAHIRELEQYGHQYLNSSTYLTGNIKNEHIGDAYLAAADALKKEVEKAADNEGIVKKILTPQILDAFSNLNPKLAQKIAGAKTLSEVRAIAAPFVRTNIMIDHTTQAAQSTFNKFADRLGNQLSDFTPTLSDPLKPLGAVANAIAESPAARTAAAGVGNWMSNAGESIGNGVNAVGNAVNQPLQGLRQAATTNLLNEEPPQPGAHANYDPNQEQNQVNIQQVNDSQHKSSIPNDSGNVNTPNDMVKIRNKKTGETRLVKKAEVGNYGLTPTEASGAGTEKTLNPFGLSADKLGQAYMAAVAAGDKKAAAQLKELYSTEAEYQKKQKPTAQDQVHEQLNSVIDDMKSLYGAGTDKSLSQGQTTTGLGGFISGVGQSYKKYNDQDYQDRMTSYENMRSLAAGIINKARQAGTLNSGEYDIMIKNMPNEHTSEKAAKSWFDNAKKLLSKLPADSAPQQDTSGGYMTP